MDIYKFNEVYKGYKDADVIQIKCDHPNCIDPIKTVKKVSAKRNISKRGGKEFICRECYMTYNNPLFNPPVEKRQTDEVINVICPGCDKQREMKKSCYFGNLEEPYEQICKSCVQKDKTISEEQRIKISDTLTGRKLSKEHKDNISKHMKTNQEGIDRAKNNLVPGYSSGWNKGLKMPPEVGKKISAATKGLKRTEEQKTNISDGRKKMLEAQGGLKPQTKEKLSHATVAQFKRGFEPKSHFKSGKHTTKNGDVIQYRSAYEKKAFLLLDADQNVEKYEYEPFSIGYRKPNDDHDSNYLIDLLVTYKDGSKKIIEVKPQKLIDKGIIERVKLEAVESFAKKVGFTYETWTEKQLFGDSEKEMRCFCSKCPTEKTAASLNATGSI